jgi:hypothetical protein
MAKKDKKELIETQKFRDWTAAFLDKSNKETYGNATQSALAVYNTDNYSSAGVIGHDNLKKLKNLGSAYADSKGLSFGRMIDIAASKMATSDRTDWWDRLMEVFDYGNFRMGSATNVTVDNRQVHVTLPERNEG